jgi:hypothetical protein
VLESVSSRKIFQFQDMLNESEQYQDAANGLYILDCCIYKSGRTGLTENNENVCYVLFVTVFRCGIVLATWMFLGSI